MALNLPTEAASHQLIREPQCVVFHSCFMRAMSSCMLRKEACGGFNLFSPLLLLNERVRALRL